MTGEEKDKCRSSGPAPIKCVHESWQKLSVWGQQQPNPGLDCLTLWTELRTAKVLKFRNMLISKKLSGWAHPYAIKAAGGKLHLLILWCLEAKWLETWAWMSKLFAVAYVGIHTFFIHPHGQSLHPYIYIDDKKKNPQSPVNLTCRHIQMVSTSGLTSWDMFRWRWVSERGYPCKTGTCPTGVSHW